MSTFEPHPRASVVWVSDNELIVRLDDGRTVSTPLSWFPRLLKANAAQRRNFEFLGDGEGIHWPDVDEDLSVAGLLAGWHTGSHAIVQEHERSSAEPLRVFASSQSSAIDVAQLGVLSTLSVGQRQTQRSHGWPPLESLGYRITQGTVQDGIRHRKTQNAELLGYGLGVSLEQMKHEQARA